MCLEDASCSEVVDLVRRRNFPSNLIDQVEGKIQECQEKLNSWSLVSFGSITQTLKKKINFGEQRRWQSEEDQWT